MSLPIIGAAGSNPALGTTTGVTIPSGPGGPGIDLSGVTGANQPNQNLASQYNYVTVQDGQVFFNPNTSNIQFINALDAAGLIPEGDRYFLKEFFKDSTDNWLIRRLNHGGQGFDFSRETFSGLNDENFAIMMRLQNTLNPFVENKSIPAAGIFLGTSFEGTGGGATGDPYSPDNPPPPGVTYSGRPVFIGQAPSGRTGGEGVFYTKEDVLLRQDEMPDLYNEPIRTMPADDQESRLPEDDTVTTMASGGIVSLAMNGMDMPTGQGIETFLNRDRSKAALQRNLQMLAQQQQMQQQQQMMAQQGPPGMPPQGPPGMPPQGMPPGMPPQGMMPPGPPPTMQQGIMPMAG